LMPTFGKTLTLALNMICQWARKRCRFNSTS